MMSKALMPLVFGVTGVVALNSAAPEAHAGQRNVKIEYALANGEKFGIWGGMSERERRRIRRQRALARRGIASA